MSENETPQQTEPGAPEERNTPNTEPEPQRYVVRHGVNRILGEFVAKGKQQFKRDDAVIIRSDRGVELGTVLCAATDSTREYLELKGESGKILRPANDDDFGKFDDIRENERNEFIGCREMISERKLQMKLVDVEHIYGGERIVFYYLAEKRIDFRELVKALAKKYRTRIEMRQIGVRDEAKLLADYGDCGQPVCCNTHLRKMPPVSMKMAKLQKATLDPNKISGRCGRLKCCLRYEYDTYEQYQRELPNVGMTVITKQGQGKVIGQEILVRKLVIQYEDGRHQLTSENEIVTVVKKS